MCCITCQQVLAAGSWSAAGSRCQSRKRIHRAPFRISVNGRGRTSSARAPRGCATGSFATFDPCSVRTWNWFWLSLMNLSATDSGMMKESMKAAETSLKELRRLCGLCFITSELG
eukprot:scaffold3153_cov243-Pinguiococcus_pyrenoidosus.AAC.5